MIDNNIVLQQFGGASNANKAEKTDNSNKANDTKTDKNDSIFDNGLKDAIINKANNSIDNEKSNAEIFWGILESLDKDREFATKSGESIDKAQDGAWDKSIYEDEEKFVDYYEDVIFGDNDKISTQDFFKTAVESGFLSEDDVAGLEAIIDKNGDGKFSKSEIRTMIRTAYQHKDDFGETETETINDIVTETETVIVDDPVICTTGPVCEPEPEPVPEYIDIPPELDPNE